MQYNSQPLSRLLQVFFPILTAICETPSSSLLKIRVEWWIISRSKDAFILAEVVLVLKPDYTPVTFDQPLHPLIKTGLCMEYPRL